jgi:hypothetical protein
MSYALLTHGTPDEVAEFLEYDGESVEALRAALINAMRRISELEKTVEALKELN